MMEAALGECIRVLIEVKQTLKDYRVCFPMQGEIDITECCICHRLMSTKQPAHAQDCVVAKINALISSYDWSLPP